MGLSGSVPKFEVIMCDFDNPPMPDGSHEKAECSLAEPRRIEMGHLGFEEIQVRYYESGSFPSGSIAVLKDGRRMITKEVYEKLMDCYEEHGRK
jgi:hypothetical protein